MAIRTKKLAARSPAAGRVIIHHEIDRRLRDQLNAAANLNGLRANEQLEEILRAAVGHLTLDGRRVPARR